MKLRGYAALGTVCLGLLAADIVQRLVIAPWVRLRPRQRVSVLGPWQHLLARFVLGSVSRIGGGAIPAPSRLVPAEPGHLILMNHQSLFDIPLVVQAVFGGYPRIVTRKRYGRFIPLISHMTRLYQYPLVDPSANAAQLRASLDSLERAGRESDVPLVVFPEGSRTRDGEIGRFKQGALVRLLRARDWTVHLLVADGFWRAARFSDLADEMGRLSGSFAHAATLRWDDPTADPRPFIEGARRIMVDTLAEMRGARTTA